MQKPQKLREFLENAIPEFKRNPDQLLIFVEGGNICSTLAQGLSFQYKYTLSIVCPDYADEVAKIAIPLLEWIRMNQSELLANFDKVEDAIKFNVDVIDNSKVDLVIELPLTERTVVKKEGNQLKITYPEEPQYTDVCEPQSVTLFDKDGTPLASWQSVQADDYKSLDVKLPHHG